MKTIMRNLTCTLLVAAAALGTGRTQSASRELSLTDIRAQSPQETIFASALCQHALEDTGKGPVPFTHTQKGWIIQPYNVDPKTFVQDLNTLMEMSDEVILAGLSGRAVVLSPSGQSVTTYVEVKVIRGWKGPHHAGDVLIFGMPFGSLPCEPSSPGIFTHRFDVDPVDYGISPSFGLPETDSFAYLLFLRQSKGNETTLVQGLRPTAGEGLQGIFLIPVHVPVPSSRTIIASTFWHKLATLRRNHAKQPEPRGGSLCSRSPCQEILWHARVAILARGAVGRSRSTSPREDAFEVRLTAKVFSYRSIKRPLREYCGPLFP